MITLDTLRAAAMSAQPWIELDKLVRAELAAGRLTRAIYDEIMSLEKEVSNTPGYTEDAHDAIGDTLDALIGFCNAKCAYKNPPVLPAEEEIAKLPRWARVAFAARCARRVFPLFAHYWENAPDAEVAAVTNAIDLTERAAETTVSIPGPEHASWTAGNAGDSYIGELLSQGQRPARTQRGADHVARSAQAAAEAATHPYAAVPVREAMHQAVTVGNQLGVPLSLVLRRDFDHLASLAEWQRWTDDTPVPPEVFGPLWPEGPPKGWPPITDIPQRTDLALEMFAREQATEQMIEDDIVNLFNALNRYHIIRSGVRLTLKQFQSLLRALERELVKG